MDKKNYFLDPERAAVYDRTRPSFHAEALSRYHKTEASLIYDHVLDIGCGTGLSSVALAAWSKAVSGIDSSQAMLLYAQKNPRVRYFSGTAEDLPFADNSFDLIFVASSLHWFERRKFLAQVSRVLKPGGKILIYDSYITGGLKKEFNKVFSDRFPRPYTETPLVDLELDFFNLVKKNVLQFDIETKLTLENIIDYYFNLSNVGAAIDRGEDKNKAGDDVREIVKSQSTGTPYIFQVQLTEILKKQ